MSLLKVLNKRNKKKSVSSLLIVLMLLSMLPAGVLAAPVTGNITGRVTGPDGLGVANASIGVWVQDTGFYGGSAQTDADGNYTIIGIAPGTYRMWVTPPGGAYLAQVRLIDIAVTVDETATVDVALEAGGIITGRVTGPEGLGIAYTSIAVWDQGTSGWDFWAWTDAGGNYTISIAPGTYDMRVSPPFGAYLAEARLSGIVVTVNETATVDVALEAGGIISGRVTGPDGAGVPNASIDVWDQAAGALGRGARTDAGGNYTISVAPGTYYMVVGPPRGAYLTQVRLSGIVVTVNETATVDVALEAGGIISGRVTGPDGLGVDNASIVVWDQTAGALGRGAQTDADGNYTIIGLPPGTYQMNVIPPQGAYLTQVRLSDIAVTVNETATVNVAMEAGGIISGRVTGPDGLGVDNASIVVWDQDTGVYGGSAQTDADGNYTIIGIAPGTYDMEVIPPQGATLAPAHVLGIVVTAGVTTPVDVTLAVLDLAAAVVAAEAALPVATQTEVTAAQALHDAAFALVDALPAGVEKDDLLVRLATVQTSIDAFVPVISVTVAPTTATINVGATEQLTATVAPANATNQAVTWTSGNTAVATVDANGLVTGVAVGSATITATTADGDLTATSTITVEVPPVLVTGIAGSVTDTNDYPAANIDVFVWDENNVLAGRGQTAADGTFAFTVAPGIYRISLLSSAGGPYLAMGFVSNIPVVANQTTVLDTIELEAGGRVSGKITRPDGSGVANATVRMMQGLSSWGLGTNKDGEFTTIALLPGTYDMKVIPLPGTNLAQMLITGIVVTAGQTAQHDVTLRDIVTIPAPGPAPGPAPTHPTVVEQPIVAGQATEVELKDVVKVTFTAGAITGAAPKVTAQVMTPAAAAALIAEATGVGLTTLSDVVVLTMTGGEFTAPVQLTLNFDAAKVATGQVPSVFVYNERTGRWIFLGGQVGDGTITVTVDRFSKFAVFATTPLPALADIADHWAIGSIRALAGMGIVSGFPDGRFNPNTGVTRAEFVSMLTRALGLEAKPEAAARFTDATDWARGAIGAAAAAGLVAGYTDGTFGGSRQITRAEMAVILQRVIRKNLVPVTLTAGADFADAGAFPAWAADGIRTAGTAGLVRGFQDRTFRPGSTTTRAEAAAMLYRLIAGR